jgi:hypothetical protein
MTYVTVSSQRNMTYLVQIRESSPPSLLTVHVFQVSWMLIQWRSGGGGMEWAETGHAFCAGQDEEPFKDAASEAPLCEQDPEEGSDEMETQDPGDMSGGVRGVQCSGWWVVSFRGLGG